MHLKKLSQEEVENSIASLIGLPISKPWQGYGSAVFFELGKLKTETTDRGKRYGVGQASIRIEWDWRVKDSRSILYGSSNSYPEIGKGLVDLQSVRIQSIEFENDVLDIRVKLSNGQTIQSATMTTGQPQWSLRLEDGNYIFPKAGGLYTGQDSENVIECEWSAFEISNKAIERWNIPSEKVNDKRCCDCRYFIPLDGVGVLLDYGVCMSPDSQFDKEVTFRLSGCDKFQPN